MSKIYLIHNEENDNVYIGSTTNQYLTTRLAQHRYYYRKNNDDNVKISYSSKKVFENEKGEECKTYIKLIDNCCCDDRLNLEQFYIDLYKDLGFNVVNNNNSIYDHSRALKKRNENYKKNANKFKLQSKIYYQKNRESIKLKNKLYYHSVVKTK